MAKLIYGDRIGAQARLRIGASAAIFDETREKLLLTQRTDNGEWCLPGGAMDAGESIAETCIREVWEETGLKVQIVRFIGVYSSPHHIVQYADGNRFQFVSFNFEAEVIGGELGIRDEVTDYGYFSPAEIEAFKLMEHHKIRIEDTLAAQETTFVR